MVIISLHYQNKVQSEMEDKLNQTMHAMKQDREESETKREQELAALRRLTDKLQREKDDSTLRFEEEKHRSMMLGGWRGSSWVNKLRFRSLIVEARVWLGIGWIIK